MSGNDLAADLGKQRVERVKKILNEANWQKCHVDGIKDVYEFLIDTTSFLVLREISNTKKDADYPRKDQKEFDIGLGKVFHGMWKGYGMKEICAIILMAGFVTVAVIYARGWMKMQTGKTL